VHQNDESPGQLFAGHLHMLQLGDWRLDVVTAARFWLDAGIMYGIVPKTIWQKLTPADDQNRIPFAIRFVVARNGRRTVLIDTGHGDKLSRLDRNSHAIEPGNSLLEALAACDVQAADVDAVVLTHLHWDHVGGATEFDAMRQARPTFPNATYFVNRLEWEDATSQAPEFFATYTQQNFLPLEQSGQLVLTDGDVEILPGLSTRVTGGHTRGHQAVLIESAGGSALIPSDLCPAVTHLRRMWCTAYDLYPTETRRCKARLLGEAADGDWWVIWGHDPNVAVSRLERHGKGDFIAVDSRPPC
jgi:glyoxylase-like metal-dependent hydrolase (beta-lactamase superfamily II)